MAGLQHKIHSPQKSTPVEGGINCKKPSKTIQNYTFLGKLPNALKSRGIYFSYTTDYYPFGSVISARSYSSGAYRFGFNNQEKDLELGNAYAFEYRIHDARLGRFLSVDPLMAKFPFYSPYHFCSNSPIMAVELEGLESSGTGTNLTEVDLPSRPNNWEISQSTKREVEIPTDAAKGLNINVVNDKTCPDNNTEVKVVPTDPPLVYVSENFKKLWKTTMNSEEAESRFSFDFRNYCAIKMSLILQEDGGLDFSGLVRYYNIGEGIDKTQYKGNGTKTGIIVVKGAMNLMGALQYIPNSKNYFGAIETYKNDLPDKKSGETAQQKFNRSCANRSGIVVFYWGSMEHIDLWNPQYIWNDTKKIYEIDSKKSVLYQNYSTKSPFIYFIPIK